MTNDRSLSVGRVVSRAFGMMARYPILVFGTASLLYGLPISVLEVSNRGKLFLSDSDFMLEAILFLLATNIVALILRGLTQGCLAHAAVADGEVRHTGLAESLGGVTRRFLPLLGVSLLLALCISLGLILLIVPGLMIAITYAVAPSVAVEERLGPIAALGRASDLTRGARWPIAGLWLLIVVCNLLLSLLGRFAEAALLGPAHLVTFSLPSLPFQLVPLTFGAALVATSYASLYAELRTWKDGPPVTRLDEIFA